MRFAVSLAAVLVLMSAAFGQEIVVKKLHGDVSVRHGVTEVWTSVSVGDVLKPDDTIKTGKKGSATLISSAKKIVLPAEVMVDISDIRHLTQEELMLKLAMERIKASSYKWKSDELNIPNATVVHGSSKEHAGPLGENDPETGTLQLNGAKVLYSNGFYPTCALKAMDVFRRFPSLGAKFDNRLIVAQALEKANLRGEALSEYVLLSTSEKLTPDQSERVRAKISQLRRQSE
jgi:hypothetical protein